MKLDYRDGGWPGIAASRARTPDPTKQTIEGSRVVEDMALARPAVRRPDCLREWNRSLRTAGVRRCDAIRERCLRPYDRHPKHRPLQPEQRPRFQPDTSGQYADQRPLLRSTSNRYEDGAGHHDLCGAERPVLSLPGAHGNRRPAAARSGLKNYHHPELEL